MKTTVILCLFLLGIAGSSRSTDGTDDFYGTENWRRIRQTPAWFFVSADGTHLEKRTATYTPPQPPVSQMRPPPETVNPAKLLNIVETPPRIGRHRYRFTTARKFKVRIFFHLSTCSSKGEF